MNIFKLILLAVLLTSCASKIVIKMPYNDSSRNIKEYITSNFKIASDDSVKNNSNVNIFAKNRNYDAAFFKINDSSSLWTINHGEPFNKTDVIMPKYSIIKVSKYKKSFTKIKIHSYEMGLFFKSKNYYKQNELAMQISNYFKQLYEKVPRNN